MIYYVLLFFGGLSTLVDLNRSHNFFYIKKYLFFLFSLLFICIAGARYNIGLPDWQVYYNNFINFGQTSYDLEPGFQLINLVIRLFTDNPLFLFLFVSFLSYIILNDIFNKTIKYKSLGFLLYLSTMYFLLNMFLMRQGLSILISVLGVCYLSCDNKNDKIKGYSLLFLSPFIHFSAVLFIILYFFCNKKLSFYFYLLLLLIGNVVFFSQINIIDFLLKMVSQIPVLGGYLYDKYQSSLSLDAFNVEASRSIIRILERNTLYLVSLLLLPILLEKQENKKLFIICWNFYTLQMFVFLFLNTYNMFEVRVSPMFSIFVIIIQIGIISCFKNKKIVYTFFVFLALFKTLLLISNMPSSAVGGFYPYIMFPI